MLAEKINRVFVSANLPKIQLSEDYDSYESWCCGMSAFLTPLGVLTIDYCHKGRGGHKAINLYTFDGKVMLLGSIDAEYYLDLQEEDYHLINVDGSSIIISARGTKFEFSIGEFRDYDTPERYDDEDDVEEEIEKEYRDPNYRSVWNPFLHYSKP